MATRWFQHDTAGAILSSLNPQDVTLGKDSKGNLIWDLQGDTLLDELRRYQYQEIEDLSGVSFSATDMDQHRKWMEAASTVPTLQEALNFRFGDPNIMFRGVPFIKAKERWENATE